MADKPQATGAPDEPDAVPPTSADANTPPPAGAPRRGMGHRGADMRDTVAEMAERAQIISQEAGTKVAAAMKDVVGAAAGLSGFAIESARDLVNYMVRRGQMTPEEGEKLMREVEAAHDRRPQAEKELPTASMIAAERAAAAKAEAAARFAAQAAAFHPFRHTAPPAPAAKPAPEAAMKAPVKAEPIDAAKPPAKGPVKTSAKKAAEKPAAAKVAGKSKAAPKSPAKAPAKTAKGAAAAKQTARPGAKTPKR
jgi:polyhydroxyalkanoate synthesis regulator phasin